VRKAINISNYIGAKSIFCLSFGYISSEHWINYEFSFLSLRLASLCVPSCVHLEFMYREAWWRGARNRCRFAVELESPGNLCCCLPQQTTSTVTTSRKTVPTGTICTRYGTPTCTHVHMYMYVRMICTGTCTRDTHTYNTSKVLMYPPLQYITNKYIQVPV